MEKKGSQKRVNIWAGPRITENMTGKSKCINRERKKKSELGESEIVVRKWDVGVHIQILDMTRIWLWKWNSE